MSTSAVDPMDVSPRAKKALWVAWICATLVVILAVILLVRTTDYMFVFFMFVGPPLLVVAAAALGWVIFQDLRKRQVL
jgi:uncharacterized integral membrane protein